MFKKHEESKTKCRGVIQSRMCVEKQVRKNTVVGCGDILRDEVPGTD